MMMMIVKELKDKREQKTMKEKKMKIIYYIYLNGAVVMIKMSCIKLYS